MSPSVKKKQASPWSAQPPAARPQTPQPAPEAALILPRFGSLWRLFLYPLCVLQPAAGLTLSALYMAQEDAQARRFGRFCLLLSVAGLAVRGLRGMGETNFQSGDSLLQPFY